MKILLLLSILTAYIASGYAIICTKCTEATYDDPFFPLRVDPSEMKCSRNPGEMACDEGVNSCWTTTITMHFTRYAGPLTLVQTDRDCGPPIIIDFSSGDPCSGEAVTEAIRSRFDPNTINRPELGMTFENLDASICFCGSDRCTPPSAATNSNPQPEPEPQATASAGGEGPSTQAPPSVEVRLFGGSDGTEGTVEVLYNGEWGTVCDDSWDVNDANVVCRMLGFSGASEAPGNARFGKGSGRIWLDDVVCSGDEDNLADCQHPEFGENNCAHSEDAGVLCLAQATTTETPAPSVRLVGGSSVNEGRVEVLYGGQWGTVCDDYWGLEDAGVVCRMLGFDGVSEAPGSARFGQGSGSIWLDDMMCSGEETDLVDCPHPAFGTHNCAHSEDAGAVCSYTGLLDLSIN